MATATESTLQAKTLSTNFTVDDLQQSIRFFEGLGFAIDDRWEDRGRGDCPLVARAATLLDVTLRLDTDE